MPGPNSTIPVYNVAVAPYSAVGDGTTDNTTAFSHAIADIQGSGMPGILYVPPSTGGFVVRNGNLQITHPNIILQGAGSMGSDGGGNSASMVLGNGSGSTFTITGMGCEVRDLAFKPGPSSSQSGSSDSYLYISQSGTTQGQIRVDNVHMYSPNIGITLTEPANGAGEYWIERLLIEGTTLTGGMNVSVGGAAVNLRHVIMAQAPSTARPQYGIQVSSAGELVMSGGCDIIAMGNCLALVPGNGQSVGAVLISDCLFDGGGGSNTGTWYGAVFVAPSGNGYVAVLRFANVWASTGSNTTANGFAFFGTGSTSPFPSIFDVSLVNCLGQGFTQHDGLYASNVVGLSVIGSTFGGNYNGIGIAAGTTNVVLNGNKCGKYTLPGYPSVGNTNYGIEIDPGVDHYVVVGNVLNGNGVGTLIDNGGGSNKYLAGNVG
jgi:hypothetical protein